MKNTRIFIIVITPMLLQALNKTYKLSFAAAKYEQGTVYNFLFQIIINIILKILYIK